MDKNNKNINRTNKLCPRTKRITGYCVGFLPPCKASKRSNALCLASFDNEAGRQKNKQEVKAFSFSGMNKTIATVLSIVLILCAVLVSTNGTVPIVFGQIETEIPAGRLDSEQAILDAIVALKLFHASNGTSLAEVVEAVKSSIPDNSLDVSIKGWILNPATDNNSGSIVGMLSVGDSTTGMSIFIPALKDADTFSPHVKFYEDFIKSEADWVKRLQITSAEPGLEKAIGAVPDRAGGVAGGLDGRIIPYFSEIAMTALLDTKDPAYFSTVKGYINWHFNNLNDGSTGHERDIGGTIFDYRADGVWSPGGGHAYAYSLYDPGSNHVVGNYDSSDSYASLLITLLNKYYELTGDTQYLIDNFVCINLVLDALFATMNPATSLTWAKIDYKIEYMMDNGEVLEGLRSAKKLYTVLAELLQGSNDIELALGYLAKASQGYENVKSAIENHLWDSLGGYYLPYAGAAEFNWDTFYADATCQVFSITTGVALDYPGRAEEIWHKFNQHYSGSQTANRWENIDIPDVYIWGSMPYAAALVGDYDRVDRYIETYMKRFILADTPHMFPLYSADAGQVLRAACVMLEYYSN